jgi:hypothetical protein
LPSGLLNEPVINSASARYKPEIVFAQTVHAGCQIDRLRALFDQISEIVDAVGGRIDIICDGGHSLDVLRPVRRLSAPA